MYTYHLGQSLTLLEGAPAPGTAAVYLLSSKELDQNPQLPGLEGVLHHTPSARDARVCKAEVHRDCLSGTVVVPRRGREGDRVAFIIKNVSASPLNISPDELTERFVRGDVARTTEGSGLGLSIAKDLTRLQNGLLEITIDGDLFKVQVSFPVIR